MNTRSVLSFVAILNALALGACSTTNGVLGNGVGPASTGALSGQFGSGSGNLVTAGNRILRNTIIGPELARQLDLKSQRAALVAEQKALETGGTGEAVIWEGSKGVVGEVVPQQTYQVGSQNCRRYSHTITVNGIPNSASGSACRNADGSWSKLT